jgi:type I restriction enzyme S subunit
MKSNYKKLGQYIREVNIRNSGGSEENLLGLSTQKVFIKSIANTIGTDFTTYKIVKRNQFTYIADTSRRGDKIAIALLALQDEAMVSQIYTVFEIVDHDELDPEYLMMWFRRPEFDRYARFKSHGSAREIFDWHEMCAVELPVPDIEKQRETVREYNVIINRIKLQEQFNQKLEQTAQTLYKYWFVDFEFPDKNGKPYKSGGGDMVWNQELNDEIPAGWSLSKVGKLATQRSEGIQSNKTLDSIAYIGLEHMPKGSIVLNQWEVVEKIGSNKSAFYKGDILFGKLRPYFHKVGIAFVDGLSSTDIVIILPKENSFYGFLTMVLSSRHFISYATAGSGGTKMPRTSWNYMSSYKVLIPDNNLMEKFNQCFKALLKKMEINSFSSRGLSTLKDLILLKMSQPELLETEQPA